MDLRQFGAKEVELLSIPPHCHPVSDHPPPPLNSTRRSPEVSAAIFLLSFLSLPLLLSCLVSLFLSQASTLPSSLPPLPHFRFALLVASCEQREATPRGPRRAKAQANKRRRALSERFETEEGVNVQRGREEGSLKEVTREAEMMQKEQCTQMELHQKEDGGSRQGQGWTLCSICFVQRCSHYPEHRGAE
ncbi:hypothetical protein EXN66_Car009049 [Channa argus]|uniref:Uncharacterized protein n=1 Tax=Channa argus TaxID=215402 RepID=A0A6G1PT63_CHAAH|nr:hypothetical protein EXN66_Car009049 [Channa argus]